jgi:hypothetical protein
MSCQFPTFIQNTFTEAQQHLTNLEGNINHYCKIPKAAQDVLDDIADAIIETAAAVVETTVEVIDTVCQIGQAARSQIDKYIDQHLDPRIATIAKAALSGLPMTCLLLVVPHPLPNIIILTSLVVTLNNKASSEMLEAFDASVVMYHLIRCVNYTAHAIFQQNAAYAVAGAIQALQAAIWTACSLR